MKTDTLIDESFSQVAVSDNRVDMSGPLCPYPMVAYIPEQGAQMMPKILFAVQKTKNRNMI